MYTKNTMISLRVKRYVFIVCIYLVADDCVDADRNEERSCAYSEGRFGDGRDHSFPGA